MAPILYGDKFAKSMNKLCKPANIKKTAEKFKALEKAEGPYSFGKFAKSILPKQADWGGNGPFKAWDNEVKGIPLALRNQLTEVIRTNLNSRRPLAMVLSVGDNVEPKHALSIKRFSYRGTRYIGMLMLCPLEPPR